MEKKYSFKEAITLSIIAGLLSALPAVISAYQASDSKHQAMSAKDEAVTAKEKAEAIEKNAMIRQARIDERDKIVYVFNIEKKKWESVYLLPISDDEAWRKYLKCTDDGESRYECANKQAQASLGHTGELVGESLSK